VNIWDGLLRTPCEGPKGIVGHGWIWINDGACAKPGGSGARVVWASSCLLMLMLVLMLNGGTTGGARRANATSHVALCGQRCAVERNKPGLFLLGETDC